ncbi:MAG: hypothetical protein HFE59_08910 [Clostridiales bacterium]|nr:hypothetical protein [Clostridiales bacterium]
MKELEIFIVGTFRSNFNEINLLLLELNKIIKLKKYIININFTQTTFFEANLLPIIFAYVQLGQVNQNTMTSTYAPESNFTKLLIRNNFLSECFQERCIRKRKETVIPFKIFKSTNTIKFNNYIVKELYKYFPMMTNKVRNLLGECIQELFINVHCHTECTWVCTCGQFYPQKEKLAFTIVNIGTTIQENVVEYHKKNKINPPSSTIEWAVTEKNSTKENVSGGWGLTFMREFIDKNNGCLQIISANEYWELKQKKITIKKLTEIFLGTIINIEINQADTKYYKLRDEPEFFDNIF